MSWMDYSAFTYLLNDGDLAFVSSNRKLISAFYKISETRLEKHLSSNYKQHGRTLQ
ncbi:hypothetical protein F443_19570 [Phytophthora nicotianae P1569]|uniref:Uncharacterized protein n=1 Tax=Phytophthora nicotianae P1569 TaxID=1317065 RepID=V9E669_PHYNI|nr:hypothetical protein F443_19570 [Phytophthora nicotianae P1569]